jgi:hypothetical protein
MIKGVQTTDRRELSREWMERRYPPSINVSPAINAPVKWTFKSLRRRKVKNPPRKK